MLPDLLTTSAVVLVLVSDVVALKRVVLCESELGATFDDELWKLQ